jgi:hypothetical protein
MTQVAVAEDATVLVNFSTLRTIDVGAQIEKKNGLSYLSWAFAVDQLLLADPSATWEYRFGKELVGPAENPVLVEVPYVRIGGTAMVFCTVNAFGVCRTAQLPVMDNRNKAITNPDSFQLNTAMQRCLAKAIALHGIGLYIYAGEDVPAEVEKEEKAPPIPKLTEAQIKTAKDAIANCETLDQLRDTFNAFDDQTRAVTKELAVALKKQLTAARGGGDAAQ